MSPRQPKITDLHHVPHQQHVLGFDVAVLHGGDVFPGTPLPAVEVVESQSRLLYPGDQFRNREPAAAAALRFAETVKERLISQPHRHDQFQRFQSLGLCLVGVLNSVGGRRSRCG